DFLKTSGWLAGFALTANTLLAEEKTFRREVVGHNDFTYQVDKEWGTQDPRQYPVMHCHEMVMDHQDRLLLTTTEPRNNILIYNKDGKIVESWTLGLSATHGLTIVGEGTAQSLWLTDTKSGRVINCTLDGRIIRELELPNGILPSKQLFRPSQTAVAPNGDIYVADGHGSNLIFHYDAKGQFIHAFGGPAFFDVAHGVAVDTRTTEPTLLITSRNGQNFQRWTLDGQHIQTYQLPGLSICRPVINGEETYFAVLSTSDELSYDGMVAVLDVNMEVTSLPGGNGALPMEDLSNIIYDRRTFLNPHDVCIDQDGNLYVPQWFSGRTYPIRLRRV
ncbi:MAG: 6-bladed beta-propeller, partial [Bacteroidota bacterium]